MAALDCWVAAAQCGDAAAQYRVFVAQDRDSDIEDQYRNSFGNAAGMNWKTYLW